MRISFGKRIIAKFLCRWIGRGQGQDSEVAGYYYHEFLFVIFFNIEKYLE